VLNSVYQLLAMRLNKSQALAKAEQFLTLGKKKWSLIAHYLQVAANSAAPGSSVGNKAEALIKQHREHLAAYLPIGKP